MTHLNLSTTWDMGVNETFSQFIFFRSPISSSHSSLFLNHVSSNELLIYLSPKLGRISQSKKKNEKYSGIGSLFGTLIETNHIVRFSLTLN